MLKGNGFWSTGQLLDPQMKIVFVTAHTGHALDAFSAGALDYLIKPVKANRRERLLGRIRIRAYRRVLRDHEQRGPAGRGKAQKGRD